MPKRKRTLAASDEAKEERIQASTVVSGLRLRDANNKPLLQVIEKVQRITAQVLSLATKVGTLVILESARASPLFCEYIFWEWCIQAVTTLRGKRTIDQPFRNQKERGRKRRAFQEPPQAEEEADADYVERFLFADIKHEEVEDKEDADHEQRRKEIIDDKNEFRARIAKAAAVIMAIPGAVWHSRDYLKELNTIQVCAYVSNLRVYVATTISKRVARVVGLQLKALIDTGPALTKRTRSQLHGDLLGYIMNLIQRKAQPNWQEKRQRLVKEHVTHDLWKAIQNIIEWHQSRLPQTTGNRFRAIERPPSKCLAFLAVPS